MTPNLARQPIIGFPFLRTRIVFQLSIGEKHCSSEIGIAFREKGVSPRKRGQRKRGQSTEKGSVHEFRNLEKGSVHEFRNLSCILD
jgi:hypothetical protein